MLDISKIRAITLDLDDTLWPIWPTIARAEQALSLWLGAQAPGAAAIFADPSARLALRRHVERMQPEIINDLSALRRESIRQALHGAQEDPALAEPAFDVFFDARMQVDLYDDARPALAFLAARYPLVALSNGNADVDRVGIGEFFTASLSAYKFGVGKPDPRIFHAAASAAGVSAEGVLHIGDDTALDVLGGLGAGMQTVWLNREAQDWPHDQQQPHLTVANLHSLCELLQAVPSRV
ncbi:MAG: putative hydrolase of the HAD superfamily [Rhodoferax sp.]|jgi:HAD superfamily hydrolase (TIGR01509 family)